MLLLPSQSLQQWKLKDTFSKSSVTVSKLSFTAESLESAIWGLGFIAVKLESTASNLRVTDINSKSSHCYKPLVESMLVYEYLKHLGHISLHLNVQAIIGLHVAVHVFVPVSLGTHTGTKVVCPLWCISCPFSWRLCCLYCPQYLIWSTEGERKHKTHGIQALGCCSYGNQSILQRGWVRTVHYKQHQHTQTKNCWQFKRHQQEISSSMCNYPEMNLNC